MTCNLRFVIMKPVGGAAWKTRIDMAARMTIEEMQVKILEDDQLRKKVREEVLRQNQTGRKETEIWKDGRQRELRVYEKRKEETVE